MADETKKNEDGTESDIAGVHGATVAPAEGTATALPKAQALADIEREIEDSKDALTPLAIQSSMAPETAAGVGLSQVVLGIVAATILLLLIYLGVFNTLAYGDLARSYDQVYLQVQTGGSALDPARIDKLTGEFMSGIETTGPSTETTNLDAIALGDDLLAARLISARQRAELAACVPFPTDTTRRDALTRCLDLLQTVKLASLAATTNYDKIRLLTEFSKTVEEHQRAFQAFWLQVAQLLLLNLLLPLLTGLFGYIFGTQGARKAAN